MKFTLDWLKEHLETTASAEEIGKALTMIGLEVEGIESQRDSEWLTGLNCEFGQGYYYSSPLPPEDALEFIARHYNEAAAQEST